MRKEPLSCKTPCDDCRKYGRCSYTPTVMRRCFFALGRRELHLVNCDHQLLTNEARLAA